MEGFSNKAESVESITDWRELKEVAPQEAKKLLSRIDGYETMEPHEKMSAVASLIEELFKEGNHNRYIANELAREHLRVEEMDRHTRRMSQLGISG